MHAIVPATQAHLVTQSRIERIAAMVLDTVSERSRHDYGRTLQDFMMWYASTS
jgi:hypothetical protein